MAGSGNDPVGQVHYDATTLQEYCLGQLLPEEEAIIRAHLAECRTCRAVVDEITRLTSRLRSDLHRSLDKAVPSPRLRFDPIAEGWRKPPRRTSLRYRLEGLAPAAPLLLLLVLLTAAFALVAPRSDAMALRGLALPADYAGPPALVAASTDHGLVLVRLDANGAESIAHLPYLTRPAQLRFSHDGAWLAVAQGGALHLLPTGDAGPHMRIPIADGADWSWSPVAPLLAYTDGRGTLSLVDPSAHLETVLVPAGEGARGMPVWSQDGASIAYTAYGTQPAASSSLWRVDPHTGFRTELARDLTAEAALLAPAGWTSDGTVLLAWDRSAPTAGDRPALYRVDAIAHHVEPLHGFAPLQGDALAGSLNALDRVLAAQGETLVLVDLMDGRTRALSLPLPHPQALAWSPTGAWAAAIIPGTPQGKGFYLIAPQRGTVRPIRLPGDGAEKAVVWAGAEHLFVIRQASGRAVSELWSVALTGDQPPQRILTGARLPDIGDPAGWGWEDVLAVRALPG